MGELESIEKLVKEYKPRMEKILGMEVGNVKVSRIENNDAEMSAGKDTIYVNLKKLREIKQIYSEEIENMCVVHELTHLLCNNNYLGPYTWNPTIRCYIREGFAEYMAFECPEIYQNEEVTERIKEGYEFGDPYETGYKFFKKVGEAIGRENILQVFQNCPLNMEEIREPKEYLRRIKEGNVVKRIYRNIRSLLQKGVLKKVVEGKRK